MRTSGPAVFTAFFRDASDLARAASAIDAREITIVPRAPGYGVRVLSKAPEGAALGAVSGGVSGGLLGALLARGALAAASIMLPGADVIVAGPLAAAFAFAGLLGAVGLAIGAAVGARIPEYEVGRGEGGGGILAVRCMSDAEGAAVKRIFDAAGALLVRRTG